MKSRTFLLVAFAAFSMLVMAQGSENSGAKKFWYGFKFGLDADSKTVKLEDLKQQLKGNYQAGLFLQFGRKLYFQPEIYYSSYKIVGEASVVTSEGTSGTENISKNIDYLKAPMLLGLKFIDLGLVAVHIDGGATFMKELNDQSDLTHKWTVGAGCYFLGFITADLRYQFQNKVNSEEINSLISDGGTVNLTVGIRL